MFEYFFRLAVFEILFLQVVTNIKCVCVCGPYVRSCGASRSAHLRRQVFFYPFETLGFLSDIVTNTWGKI